MVGVWTSAELSRMPVGLILSGAFIPRPEGQGMALSNVSILFFIPLEIINMKTI